MTRSTVGSFAFTLVPALALLAYLPAPAAAQAAAGMEGDPQVTEIEIPEWTVPWEGTRPRDPYGAPDGKIWFVGQAGNYAAYFDPATEEFKRYDLPDGAGPHTLIVHPENGTVYYAGNRAAHIGKIDPETGEIHQIPMPDERARDPHTLAWTPERDIWFTVQQGNFVGFLDTETEEVRLVEMPQAPGRGGSMGSSRPYGIKMDSKGHPWIVLFNTNKIATIDPATFERKVYDLPAEDARPRRLVIDSKDQIWYVDYARGYLGHLDPATGEVREWANPGGERSRPYGVAIDADDRIWFVETGLVPNQFVGFDPDTEKFFSVTELENEGGGAVRHMYYDRSNNTIWFGTDWNTVGQAKLPPLKKNPIS